jgi:anti-anti-sigma regulatory factor
MDLFSVDMKKQPPEIILHGDVGINKASELHEVFNKLNLTASYSLNASGVTMADLTTMQLLMALKQACSGIVLESGCSTEFLHTLKASGLEKFFS